MSGSLYEFSFLQGSILCSYSNGTENSRFLDPVAWDIAFKLHWEGIRGSQALSIALQGWAPDKSFLFVSSRHVEHVRVWFPNSSFQQVRQPSISTPLEEDTSKIWDITGTIIIQGPSIVLLVCRSIIFNGSFLRVCRILRFVKKIRLCLLESGRTKPWCPGLVSRPSAKA